MQPYRNPRPEDSPEAMQDEANEEHHSHQPFMSKVPIKSTPIGYEMHQIQVPDFNPNSALKSSPVEFSEHLKQNLEKDVFSRSLFLSSKVKEEEVSEYLAFIESYMEEKTPDFFSQSPEPIGDGLRILFLRRPLRRKLQEESSFLFWVFELCLASRERTRCRALQLLHECDYNYIKAKFYVLFPYYKTYNQLRCHEPLRLSDEEMWRKIHAHIANLKNSKQNDLVKWVQTIENEIESRIHISKFTTYLDLAKQNKFEIPENIKEMFERAIKIGKDLKKTVLNSKNSLEKLERTKAELRDQKIITNEMTHFEEAVARSEEWIKKQLRFEEQYFERLDSGGQTVLAPRSAQFFRQTGKIEYKALQSLVSEYNSLPLSYPSFAKTSQVLFDQANKLIARIPSLNKAAKTRKSDQTVGVVKLQRRLIFEILGSIEATPIEHEDFSTFKSTISEGLEQLERIGMFLEDTQKEKNVKHLTTFQKVLSEIPIENSAQKSLEEKIEYYEMIERIKKDIANPAKYQTLKDQLTKLRLKGYECEEHLRLEQRVVTCMGWHESLVLVRESRGFTHTSFIISQGGKIRKGMIRLESFRSQLELSRKELSIPEDTIAESELRLTRAEQYRRQALELAGNPSPCLEDYISLFRGIYQNGILFQGFETFYEGMRQMLVILAQIHYLLLLENDPAFRGETGFAFSNVEAQKIVESNCDSKLELRDLRTKQTGDMLLERVRNSSSFPKLQPEWRAFQEFMQRAQEWSDEAMRIIEQSRIDDNISDLRRIIEESKHCLHSKMVEEELSKVEIVLKWREKISKKMNTSHSAIFSSAEELGFVEELQRTLRRAEAEEVSQEETRGRVLRFMHEKGVVVNSLLRKVQELPSDELVVVKLSEMNKFIKEVDREIERYRLSDRAIEALKEELQAELLLNEDWKERYFCVKRFEKKKMAQPHIVAAKEAYYHNLALSPSHPRKRSLHDEPELAAELDVSADIKDERDEKDSDHSPFLMKSQPMPYVPMIQSRVREPSDQQQPKRKYFIRNADFCVEYRLLLMLLEFYNGCQLKFVVEEFLKLKTLLIDVYRVIEKYNHVMLKPNRTDEDYEHLDSEITKVPIFFKESHLAHEKHSQIMSWKLMAEHVLKSLPVINMELKVRKASDLRQLIEKTKVEKQKISNEQKMIPEQRLQESSSKRRRKPNQFYDNNDMTLLRDDLLAPKKNKRRKSNNPSSEMTNDPDSSKISGLASTSGISGSKRVKGAEKQVRNEDEHIEAFLNGDFNPDAVIIDDPKQYCICRNGVPNENSVMVQCEECTEWFHIECVGLKKHQVKNDEVYECVACRLLKFEVEAEEDRENPQYTEETNGNGQCSPSNGHPAGNSLHSQHFYFKKKSSVSGPMLGYFWDHHHRMSEYALEELYEEGKKLEVQTPELAKLEVVYRSMQNWKQETNELLERIMRENSVQLSDYHSELYPLFLQSLWLPTLHVESIFLKKIMKEIYRQNGGIYVFQSASDF